MVLKYFDKIVMLCCFLLTEFAFSQIYCPVEESFLGPVVSVKETIYELPQHVVSSADHQDSLILTYHTFYTVENGRVTNKRILGASGSQKCRCTLSYTKDGNIHEKATYGSNDLVDTRVVNTWSNDQLVRIDRFDIHDSLYSSTVYIHDDKAHTLVSKEVFNDTEENVIYSELDQNDQPLRRYMTDIAETKKLYAEFEYDSLGRVIVTHVWNYSRKYDQHFMTYYDSLGRVVKRDWFERDGVFKGADSIVYDQNSNVVFEHSYDFILGYWSTVHYKLQLDDYGNMVMKETWNEYLGSRELTSRIYWEYTYRDE